MHAPLFLRLFVSSYMLLNHPLPNQSHTKSFIDQLCGKWPPFYGFVEGQRGDLTIFCAVISLVCGCLVNLLYVVVCLMYLAI